MATTELSPCETQRVVWTNALEYFERILLVRADVAHVANDYSSFGFSKGLTYEAFLAKYYPRIRRRELTYAGQ